MSNRSPIKSNSRSQTGFSLVELMIAMTLSLMLLGAVLQVFLSSKMTSDLTDDISRIQENGRFSLDFLAQNIRMAGYSDIPMHKTENALYNSACGSFGSCTDDGGTNESDRIAITINPIPDSSGAETDCTGAAVGSSDLIANVYYVTTNGNISSLTCRGYNISTGAWVAAEQPLIDGIDNMQLLYGIDSDMNDKAFQVTRFVSADQVTNWGSVRAVRIGLLVSSGDTTGSADQRSRNYALFDATQISIDDRSVRQIYTTTVTINNA